MLTGHRNANDGLYDIPIYKKTDYPVQKTHIQEGNYRLPSLHNIYERTDTQKLPPQIGIITPTSSNTPPPAFPSKYHIDSISPGDLQVQQVH